MNELTEEIRRWTEKSAEAGGPPVTVDEVLGRTSAAGSSGRATRARLLVPAALLVVVAAGATFALTGRSTAPTQLASDVPPSSGPDRSPTTPDLSSATASYDVDRATRFFELLTQVGIRVDIDRVDLATSLERGSTLYTGRVVDEPRIVERERRLPDGSTMYDPMPTARYLEFTVELDGDAAPSVPVSIDLGAPGSNPVEETRAAAPPVGTRISFLSSLGGTSFEPVLGYGTVVETSDGGFSIGGEHVDQDRRSVARISSYDALIAYLRHVDSLADGGEGSPCTSGFERPDAELERRFLGLAPDEAKRLAWRLDRTFRVVSRNGACQPTSLDLDSMRIDAVVVDGEVVAITTG